MPSTGREGDGGGFSPGRRVGERIRSTRIARATSLSALAAAARVGKGSLSEIEQGLRNPTLGTLYALAVALDVPLSWLLAEQVGAEASSDVLTSVLLDVEATDDATIEVFSLTVRPGGVHRSSAHGAGVSEHLLVLRGSVMAGLLGEEVELDEGGSTTWISDRDHSYRTPGAEPARVLLTMRWPGRRVPRLPDR